MTKLNTALVIPDTHIPFHDQRAYDLMLEVATYQDISEVVILGDYADFYQINSYGTDPRIKEHFFDEVEAVYGELRFLRDSFPAAKIVYLMGNHEYRLERFIEQKAPELFGLLELPKLFHLSELKIQSIPYGPNQIHSVLGSQLYARHEPLGGNQHAAHNSVVRAGCSLIMGHLHRIQESQVVMINGSNHRGIMCGWLGDTKHPVMQYVKNHHQWALGFALVHQAQKEPDRFFVEVKHIIDYRVHHLGHILEG